MRTTIKQLERKIERLNNITGSPQAQYSKKEDGRFTANVGNFHLSEDYGKKTLHRMYNEAGGISDVFGRGHSFSSGELADMIDALTTGILIGKGLK